MVPIHWELRNFFRNYRDEQLKENFRWDENLRQIIFDNGKIFKVDGLSDLILEPEKISTPPKKFKIKVYTPPEKSIKNSELEIMNEDSPLRKSSKPLNLPAEFQEKNPLALFKKIHDTVGEKYLFGRQQTENLDNCQRQIIFSAASVTALQQFFPIFENDSASVMLDELEEAFSVERVTKEFFEKYAENFYQIFFWWSIGSLFYTGKIYQFF